MANCLNFTGWRWLLPMALAICGAPASAGDTMAAATEPTSRYRIGGGVSQLPQTDDGRFVLHGSARYSDQASDASGRFLLHKTLGASCSLSDDLFVNGFEGSAANPDIVVFSNVNFSFPATGIGGSIQWSTGLTCACDTAPYDLNVWLGGTGKLQYFWPGSAANRGGVAVGGVYQVLAPGATIGPASIYISTAGTSEAATWAAGASGYLGFRFVHPVTSQVNYGYARITSTGPNGHPATLLSYAYDRSGAAITIPAP